MKKQLILIDLCLVIFLVFFTGNAFAGEDCWQACGNDIKEARENLASQILVNVKTNIKVKKTKNTSFLNIPMIKNFFSSEIRSETSMESSQNVNMPLVNAKIMSESKDSNGKICLKLCKKDLEKYKSELIKKTKTYYPKNLPAYEKDKKKTISLWLNDIALLKNLIVVLGSDEVRLERRLVRQEKTLKDINSRIFGQYVLINSEFSKAVLTIDGKKKAVGKRVFITPGEHRYMLSFDGFCSVRDEFTLESGKDKVINIELEPYPEIVITSNKPEARLVLDGKRWVLGKAKTIKRCDGEATYLLEYGQEKESGTISLSPGMKENKKRYFYSDKDMNKLKKMASVFTSGKTIEVGYFYSIPGSDFEDLENVHNFNMAFYKNFRFIRLGLGVSYGKTENDSVAVDGYLSLLFQLSELGSAGNPIHFFGLFPIIPYAGVDSGVGYHDIYNEKAKETEHKFKTPDNMEEDDFARDNFILRAEGGFNIPLNNTIGLKLFYGKNFHMDESSIIGSSLVFRF